MHQVLALWLLLLLSGCSLSEMGKRHYDFESDIPLPESKTLVATPARVQKGDCEWDKVAFELGVSFDEWAAKLERELVERQGFTRKPHGGGFLYRSERYEVLLVRTVRDREQKVEMRIGILRKGARLPDEMVTVEI